MINAKKLFIFIFIVIQFFFCVNAREYHAAIYVDDDTGIAGTAFNFSTKEEASINALKMCKKKSGKKTCAAIQLFSNGCGAAAWSPKNRYARGAIADTSAKVAEDSALRKCVQSQNDPNCVVVSSICTDWEVERARTLMWW